MKTPLQLQITESKSRSKEMPRQNSNSLQIIGDKSMSVRKNAINIALQLKTINGLRRKQQKRRFPYL